MAGPVKDREALQRLSFLYQEPENQALARFYCHTERNIAKRLVLRRDPSVKRTLCRGCSSLLIPGLTCTQRQRHDFPKLDVPFASQRCREEAIRFGPLSFSLCLERVRR
ncbi:Ribonuclease P protein subunit p21, partial [Camelus dromedarius]